MLCHYCVFITVRFVCKSPFGVNYLINVTQGKISILLHGTKHLCCVLIPRIMLVRHAYMVAGPSFRLGVV